MPIKPLCPMLLVPALAAALIPGGARAQDGLDVEGRLGLTLRSYTGEGLYRGQEDNEPEAILSGSLATDFTLGEGDVVLEFSGEYNTRTGEGYADLPRAYYQYVGDGFDLLVGSTVEYWGVSESHQAIDVINQRYAIDNPVDNPRLGQPMVNLNIATGMNSTLSLYGLLGFREKEFEGLESRFRGPLLVDEDEAYFEEGDGKDLDFALRWRSSLAVGSGSLDVALSYFNGTDRTPKLLPGCVDDSLALPPAACDAVNDIVRAIYEDNPEAFGIAGGGPQNDDEAAQLSQAHILGFTPYYQHLEQVGLELVYSYEDLQLTFEGGLRKSMGETYFTGIAGAQYTLNDVFNTGGTGIVVAEYLYDDRSAAQPMTLFDDDVFLGFLYSGSDTASTSFRGGVYVDVNTDAQIYSLSYSRRLTDAIRLDLSGFAVNASDYDDPLAYVDDDAFVEAGLSFFF